jgi:(+)-abscisic acid 8'-hydroxylase
VLGVCRWEVVGSSDDVTYSPFPVPKRGLLARLSRATTGSAVVGRAPPLHIGGPAGASYS